MLPCGPARVWSILFCLGAIVACATASDARDRTSSVEGDADASATGSDDDAPGATSPQGEANDDDMPDDDAPGGTADDDGANDDEPIDYLTDDDIEDDGALDDQDDGALDDQDDETLDDQDDDALDDDALDDDALDDDDAAEAARLDGGLPAGVDRCEAAEDCQTDAGFAPCTTVVGMGSVCLLPNVACERFCFEPDVCNIEPGDFGPRVRCEPPSCPDAQTRCGEECVDTNTDDAHCGECDFACPASLVCNAGFCHSPECPIYQISCDDACVDPRVDPDACGDCATACGDGEYCTGGRCLVQPNYRAGTCVADAALDEPCAALGPELPSGSTCVFYDGEQGYVEYTPPADCELVSMGDTRDTYCCPATSQ